MEVVPEGRADTDTVAGRRLESTADSQAAPSAGSGGGTDTSELSQGSEENPPPPHLQRLLRAHRSNQWRQPQRVGLTLTLLLAPIQETGTDKNTAESQAAPSAGSGGGTDTSELSQGSEENPPPPPPVAAQSTQEQPMEGGIPRGSG